MIHNKLIKQAVNPLPKVNLNPWGFKTEKEQRQFAFFKKQFEAGELPLITKQGKNAKRILDKRKQGGKIKGL